MNDLQCRTRANEWWVYGYNEDKSGRYNRVCCESYSVKIPEAAQTKPAMMSRYRNKGESAKRMMRRCRRFSESHKTLQSANAAKR